MAIKSQVEENNSNATLDVNEVTDLKKSVEDSLEKLDTIMKSKSKKWTKKDIEEMMKDKENKKLLKECMKGSNEEDDDEEDEDEDDEEDGKEKGKIKKSISDLEVNNSEIFDAVPILKSFTDILLAQNKKIDKLFNKVDTFQKSMEEEQEIVKSFADVVKSEADLIKSISDNVELIGNAPTGKKGKISKEDILKSQLDDNNMPMLKSVNIGVIKDVLLKSVQSGKISSTTVSRWEQSRYNMNVFNRGELAFIESQLK